MDRKTTGQDQPGLHSPVSKHHELGMYLKGRLLVWHAQDARGLIFSTMHTQKITKIKNKMSRGWTDSSVVKNTEFSSQYPCQTACNHLETQLQRKRHPHDISWEHLGPHVRNPSGYVPLQIKYNPLSLILGTNQGRGYRKSDLNRKTHYLSFLI